ARRPSWAAMCRARLTHDAVGRRLTLRRSPLRRGPCGRTLWRTMHRDQAHDLEKIAPTAEFTAAAWAALGFENAQHFVTARGQRLLRAYELVAAPLARGASGGPTLVEYLAYRHGAIDKALAAYAPDRVIECAAGLSRRGITLASDGVPVLELDLPHMVREKAQRLERAGWPDALAVESCDLLTDAFERRARAFLAGARRPAIVAEGFLPYRPLDVRVAFLGRVAQILRETGGCFVGDFRCAPQSPRARVTIAAFRLMNRAITSGRGIREDFPSFDALA